MRILWRLWGVVLVAVGIMLAVLLGLREPNAYSMVCSSPAPAVVRCTGTASTLIGDSHLDFEQRDVSDMRVREIHSGKGKPTYRLELVTPRGDRAIAPFDPEAPSEADARLARLRALVFERVPGTLTISGKRSATLMIALGGIMAIVGLLLIVGWLPPSRSAHASGRTSSEPS